ncbi:MAG: sensor histidine kinase, partial [Polyangiaceae bacterium]
RTIELLTPLAAKKQVALKAEGVSTTALVDPNQIQQVFANLVVNAIHASHARGNVDVTVSEETARPPVEIGGHEIDCVRVRVHDCGAGIAAEDISRVFEPFFTTKDVGEGTGLGLAVAYGIVRDHGGWIDVVSEKESGTEFSIFLKKTAE